MRRFSSDILAMSERNPFDPGGEGNLSHLGAAGGSGGVSYQGKGSSSPEASSSGGYKMKINETDTSHQQKLGQDLRTKIEE